MAFANYKRIGKCLSLMTAEYLSKKHSIEFLLIGLRSGWLQARGLPGSIYQRDQPGDQNGPVIIPTSFWRAFDRRRHEFPSSWNSSYLEALVGLTNEPYAYREIELDWQAITARLQDILFQPPYFKDAPHQADEGDFASEWFEEDTDPPPHTEDLDDEGDQAASPGRPRAAEWNDWVAELVFRVGRGEITARSNVSSLIRAVAIHLEKRRLKPPPPGTVRGAASAVLERLSPDAD